MNACFRLARSASADRRSLAEAGRAEVRQGGALLEPDAPSFGEDQFCRESRFADALEPFNQTRSVQMDKRECVAFENFVEIGNRLLNEMGVHACHHTSAAVTQQSAPVDLRSGACE
jgi:hypothetical protein